MANPIALRETLAVLNEMEAAGVIGRYAICGAVAAFRYIEPAVTQDLDISVTLLNDQGSIVTFDPIRRFLNEKGLPAEWRAEGLVMGFWPVQFLTASDPLDSEALAEAQTIMFDGVATRVWRAEHLMAKCPRSGGPRITFVWSSSSMRRSSERRSVLLSPASDWPSGGAPTAGGSIARMSVTMTPDQIFAAKQAARQRFQAMSFEDRIRLVERMRQELAPLRQMRETHEPSDGPQPSAHVPDERSGSLSK